MGRSMTGNRYATLDALDGLDFRSIALEMKQDGHRMGASRVRLIMVEALEKIVEHVAHSQGIDLSHERAHEIAVDPDFQNVVAPFVRMAYGVH